jgi:hypothetical protein
MIEFRVSTIRVSGWVKEAIKSVLCRLPSLTVGLLTRDRI